MADIKGIGCEKGMYDLFSSRGIAGGLFLPQYCFDRLLIKLNNSETKTINVNTRMFGFDKILKQAAQLKQMDKF